MSHESYTLVANYSGTPILRYGKGQQNSIVQSGYRCKLPLLILLKNRYIEIWLIINLSKYNQ